MIYLIIFGLIRITITQNLIKFFMQIIFIVEILIEVWLLLIGVFLITLLLIDGTKKNLRIRIITA